MACSEPGFRIPFTKLVQWPCRSQSQIWGAVKLCNPDGMARKQRGDALDWLLTITYAHAMQARVDLSPVILEQATSRKLQAEEEVRGRAEEEVRGRVEEDSDRQEGRGRSPSPSVGRAMLASSVTVDVMRRHFEDFPLRKEELEGLSSPDKAPVPALLPSWLGNISLGGGVHLDAACWPLRVCKSHVLIVLPWQSSHCARTCKCLLFAVPSHCRMLSHATRAPCCHALTD